MSYGFFFLMIRRQPRSTRTYNLLPYTMLFLSSSSPGTMICKLLAGGIAPMDQRQPLDCEIAIDMIEDGGVLFEQKREASGGDDLGGPPHFRADAADQPRSEEHTSELQSLMRSSYAVFCLKKKKTRRSTK